MSEQLVFPSFSEFPELEPTDGLFLALVPPAAKVALIGELVRQCRQTHELRGRSLSPSCLHVSLHHLGVHDGVPDGLVHAVSAAMATFSVPPFEIKFTRAMSFINKRQTRPFVLRAGGDTVALTAFHRVLGETIANAGLGSRVSRYFTPHMTLLWDRRLVEEHAIEPIGWTVTDVVLVHSLIRRSCHIHLARWPLRS